MRSISILSGILLFGLTSGASAGAPDMSPPSGHVVSVNGTQAWIAEGKERIPLKPGLELRKGDVVQTGDQTSAKLLLGQGEVALLLKPNSTLLVQKAEKRDYRVVVKTGALLSTVRKPVGEATHFSIQTRAATMGVRGTTLYVRDEPGKPVFFCPCHGKINVRSKDGSNAVDFDSVHHDTPKLIAGGNSLLSARMTPMPGGYEIGHSDDEIADLQKLLKD